MPQAWLTPDNIEEADTLCRPLSIDRSLAAYVTGALLPLTQPWNWEQHGTMTAQEASELFTVMLENWVTECNEGCICEVPLDEDFGIELNIRIIRRSATGHTQELVDGEWVTPTGDYEVPPIPEREEALEVDRLCLAAANAAFVLESVYEEVTDAIAIELSAASVFGAIFDAAIALVGVWAGPTAAGHAAFAKTAFDAFVQTADALGSDVWNAAFTDELTCFLHEFAQSDGNVVTFEFPQMRAAVFDEFLNAGGELDTDRALLWGQVGYLMDLLAAGGIDTAGSTTAVTEYDCIPCDDFCYFYNLGTNNGGFQHIAPFTLGTWTPGGGWLGSFLNSASQRNVYIEKLFDNTYVREFTFGYDKAAGSGANNATQIAWYRDGALIGQDTTNAVGIDMFRTFTVDDVIDRIIFSGNTGTTAAVLGVESLTVIGVEPNPFTGGVICD